ncbi:MAG: ATP-binding protein [Pseudodesulfovibrio sp.]
MKLIFDRIGMKGLAPRLVISILIFSSIVTFFATGVQLYMDYSKDVESITSRLSQIRVGYSESITKSLWVSNMELLQSQVNDIGNLPDIAYVKVETAEGKVLKHGTEESANVITRTVEFNYDFRGQKLPLGSITVIATLEGVYSRLWSRVFIILITQALKTFAVSFFILYLFQRVVGRPLSQMAIYSKSLKSDSLDEPLILVEISSSNGNNELNVLASAINSMRIELKDAIDDLRMVNSTLKKSEESLQKSDEILRGTFNATAEGILVVDNHGKILISNDRFRLMWNIPQHLINTENDEEIIKSVLGQLKNPESFKAEVKGIYSGDEERFDDLHFKDGRIFERYTCQIALEDQVIGRVWNFRDITKRVGLELQLAMAHKLEAVGQLASGIAHEINTPLQYIGGNLKFMRDSLPELEDSLNVCKQRLSESSDVNIAEVPSIPEEMVELTQEWKSAIVQNIEGVSQISTIVQAMKIFAHPDTQSIRAVDFNEIVKNTVVIARNEWKYVADVEQNLDDNLPLVPCNPGEMNQTILILLVNAAHAIATNAEKRSEKGKIIIMTSQEDEMLVLSVQDNGCGIPVENIRRVYDHFFTTKEIGKGTGQGLAIAHAMIKKHSGSIELDSQVGVGTTFTVRLPL